METTHGEVKGIYIDGWLKSNLDILKKNIHKDWDFWFLVDGFERSGKSTLATQCALYLDPTFCIDRVVFTPKQFEEAVNKSEKYQAIVWDEAVTGTMAVDYTKMARTLQKKAIQIGQKNLFIVLVLHSYFEMKKYFAVFRTWFLLHVYVKADEENDTFSRGYFEYYDFKKKKNMYVNDKARRTYTYYEKPNFRGRFVKQYGVEEQAYREKKSKIESGEEAERMDEKTFIQECLIRGMSVKQIQDYCKYSQRSLYNINKSLQN